MRLTALSRPGLSGRFAGTAITVAECPASVGIMLLIFPNGRADSP
jgi:hypothetical protein